MRSGAHFIVVALLMGTAHAAEPAPQQQLQSTLQDLEKTKQNEAVLKKKLASTQHEMDTMRERSTTLAQRLQESERRVSMHEELLGKASAAYTKKSKEFDARKADYAATVMSLLALRHVPPTAIFSSGEDTQNLLRTASVLEKTNAAVAGKAARLREDMAQMKALQADTKQRDARTRAEKASLKSEQEKLAAALLARQKLQEKLSADHKSAEEKVAELSRASKSLQELMTKLAQEAKAKEKSQPDSKKTAKLRDFDGKKGSLRTPVAGAVLHRFGERNGENGSYRGMVFKARAGATVVSPYDGEVVFTGPFRDYGKMVLIKHKNGYISLIAGLGDVNASLNQTALRGEPIGTMPGDGNGEAYVELRDSDAKPIDPADWFANVVK